MFTGDDDIEQPTLTETLVIGLASFFLVQLSKRLGLVPESGSVQTRGTIKLVLVLIYSFLLAYVSRRRLIPTLSTVIVSSSGAGVAVVIHKLTRLLSVSGDDHMEQLLRRRR